MTQKEALDILKMGHNVYVTGQAGSGKTYLLNQYIDYLRLNKISVGITASTGIAATHMGGTTIHSWSGIGIKDELTDEDLKSLLKKKYLQKHLLKTKVLIIDEISMLHARQLDMIDKVCRVFRKNNEAFGGLQVIMCGDFYQLPPVNKGDIKADFVTGSRVWNEMDLHICYLGEQFRQDDRALLRVLNDIRRNEVSEMTVEYLSERLDKEVKGYVNPTRLFTHNADVDAMNLKHLNELKGESVEYLMNWRGGMHLIEGIKRSCLAPETLILKKGAQVMFVKNNFEKGYVNGTLGEVIGFSENKVGDQANLSSMPIVRTYDGNEITVGPMSWEVREDDKVLAAISQLPLRLAWAITVHKSQGMTLDAAEIDLSRSFLPGMGYVALSRVRSLSGLKLMGMNQMALQINQDVCEMDGEFVDRSNKTVRFLSNLNKDDKRTIQNNFLHKLKR